MRHAMPARTTFPLLALIREGAFARRRHDGTARLDELCEFAPANAEQEELVLWFTQLVAWLRSKRG